MIPKIPCSAFHRLALKLEENYRGTNYTTTHEAMTLVGVRAKCFVHQFDMIGSHASFLLFKKKKISLESFKLKVLITS